MKNISKPTVLILSLLLIFMQTGCVEDTEIQNDLKKVAKLTMENSEDFTVEACSEKLYKITFEVNNSEGKYFIENGKQATFNVTNGKLVDVNDLTNNKAVTQVNIQNRKAEVYYRPDNSANQKVELTVMVEPYTFTKTIEVLPIEPSDFKFENSTYIISKTATLNLNVVLTNAVDACKASAGLPFSFSYESITSDNVANINFSPVAPVSTYTSNDVYSKVSVEATNVSQISDTILVSILYKGIPRDSAKVYYTD